MLPTSEAKGIRLTKKKTEIEIRHTQIKMLSREL